MNINFHCTLVLLTVCRCLFSAASLGGGVVGLSPLWMEQGKIVGIASGFRRFFIGNPIASR